MFNEARIVQRDFQFSHEKRVKVFKAFDKDGTGDVTADEAQLKHVFKRRGEVGSTRVDWPK